MMPAFVAESRPDRLFLAALPGAREAERIAALAGRLKRARRLEGRLIRREHLHVTLLYLGSWHGLPQGIVARARAAAAAVKVPPFAVAFDRTASFHGRTAQHPFVLLGGDGVGALKAFRAGLGAAMAKAGLGPRVPGAYTPHVTLLYDACFVEEAPIEPIAWTVGEFVLVHSLYGRSRHIPLARWPLRAD